MILVVVKTTELNGPWSSVARFYILILHGGLLEN